MAKWVDNATLRGKNLVNISTTVPLPKAKELEQYGDWLQINGYIKKNTAYAVNGYAIDLFISAMRKQLGKEP